MRSELAVLALLLGDLTQGVVIRAVANPLARQPEIEGNHQPQACGQKEAHGPHGLLPLGGDPVDRGHDQAEDADQEKDDGLDLHTIQAFRDARRSASLAARSDAGAASGWCKSKAGRSERIRGMELKLWRGGGQDVAHSSDAP